jgi:hypothetical protein
VEALLCESAIGLVSNISRCTLPKHRQECLCHTGFRQQQHLGYSRMNVAQTLLSVLVRLATIENISSVS